MKISLQKVGGLLGTPRPSAELDTERLCEEDRHRLQQHLDSAKFWELPEELTADSAARDAQGTILQVDDEGRSHAVGFELATAPDTVKALVSLVRALASK